MATIDRVGDRLAGDGLSDDELAAAALAADPDVVVADDAVCVWDVLGPAHAPVLPEWYMPAPMAARSLHGWRRVLVRCNVAMIVAAFLAINAAGLCNTYGQLHL